jgi:hypothetical protein
MNRQRYEPYASGDENLGGGEASKVDYFWRKGEEWGEGGGREVRRANGPCDGRSGTGILPTNQWQRGVCPSGKLVRMPGGSL